MYRFAFFAVVCGVLALLATPVLASDAYRRKAAHNKSVATAKKYGQRSYHYRSHNPRRYYSYRASRYYHYYRPYYNVRTYHPYYGHYDRNYCPNHRAYHSFYHGPSIYFHYRFLSTGGMKLVSPDIVDNGNHES